jgi:hypothetical protein
MKRTSMILVAAAAVVVAGLPASATVDAVKWQPTQRLTRDAGASFAADVAADEGVVHVVWIDRSDGVSGDRLFYRQSLDGGSTWSKRLRLARQSSVDNASIAVSGSSVHVAWVHAANHVRYRVSHDGGTTWESRTRLSSPKLGFRDRVDLAVWGDTVHAVWGDSSVDQWEIWHRRSHDGGVTWEKRKRITRSEGGGYAQFASVAARGQKVHIVWWIGPNGGVGHRRSATWGQTWSSAVVLAVPPAWGAPQVTAPRGSVVVSWTEWVAAVTEPAVIYRQSVDTGRSWSAPQLISDMSDASAPSLASDGKRVHIIWSDSTGTFYRRSGDGGTSWTTPRNLPNGWWVAADGRTAHVLWSKQVKGNWEVFYKRRA